MIERLSILFAFILWIIFLSGFLVNKIAKNPDFVDWYLAIWVSTMGSFVCLFLLNLVIDWVINGI